MADENVIREGKAAAELLRSESFTTVLRALKDDCFAKWASTTPEQGDAREDYYYIMLGFDLVKEQLQKMADNARFDIAKSETKTNIIDFSQQ